MTRPIAPLIALASAMTLPTEGDVPEWVHLLPVTKGDIPTFDGRPFRLVDAAQVIAASLQNERGMPIDENHATDLAAPKGQPAPARGWIVELQQRQDGIWGKVEWTEEGRALVQGKAYRGLSPVLAVGSDKKTVKALLRASLVNTPNLRGLTALNQETPMEFMEKLAEALGLKADASEEDILGAVTARTGSDTALQASLAEIGVALGVEGDVSIEAVAGAAKTFGKETVVALQAQLATITGELNTLKEQGQRDKATAFVDGAIADGRVGVKPLRDHYIARHMADPASVEKEIAAFPKLDGTVIAGQPKATAAAPEVSLNAEQRGVRLARAAQEYQAEQKAKGIDVPWADAVTHVSEKR